MELVEEARQRCDAHARINVHLAWFGNELVGEHGIAQNPNWPRMTAQMATDLMADSLRHLRWLELKCHSYGHLLVIGGYFYGIIHSTNGVT